MFGEQKFISSNSRLNFRKTHSACFSRWRGLIPVLKAGGKKGGGSERMKGRGRRIRGALLRLNPNFHAFVFAFWPPWAGKRGMCDASSAMLCISLSYWGTRVFTSPRGGEGQREVVLSAHISCSTFYPLLSSVAEEFWPGFTACHLFLAPLLLPPSHHHLSPPFLRDFYPPDGKGFLRSRSLGIKTFSPPSLFFGSCC